MEVHAILSSMQILETKTSQPYSSQEQIIIDRTMQTIQDRTQECFDDYIPCRKKKFKLKHVKIWLQLFVNYHNKGIRNH
jgi:putative transposase